MEPLAYLLRPKTFDDVLGHEQIITILKKMIEEDHFQSMILYGATGTGKTTLAMLVANYFELNHFKFNASTDSKAVLKQIIDTSKHYGSILLIVDEIHRMNKDIQDYLLPYVESGQVIMFGLTTENPYIAVNPAIRSRVIIYRLQKPTQEEIMAYLKKISLKEYGYTISMTDEIYKYISYACNGELRSAINMIETLGIVLNNQDSISLEEAKQVIAKPAISTDKNGNDYYDILSAFH